MEETSTAGPFDQWPLQRGFDRYYGFLEGETDQFSPSLTYDNHHIDPPGRAEDGSHVSEDLIDHAIGFVHDTKSVRPDKPFFLYVAFGATHAPHQAPADYLEKYRGRYDEGWDVVRERWFANQLAMGCSAFGDCSGTTQPRGRSLGRPLYKPTTTGVPVAGSLLRIPRPHRRANRTACR